MPCAEKAGSCKQDKRGGEMSACSKTNLLKSDDLMTKVPRLDSGNCIHSPLIRNLLIQLWSPLVLVFGDFLSVAKLTGTKRGGH